MVTVSFSPMRSLDNGLMNAEVSNWWLPRTVDSKLRHIIVITQSHLTLAHPSSQLSIARSRSTRLHPVSAQSGSANTGVFMFRSPWENVSHGFVSTSPGVEGCPRGVMVKALDCGILVREFELQSRNYVDFRINTLGKGITPPILPSMG